LGESYNGVYTDVLNAPINESILEEAGLEYLTSLGWHVLSGSEIAPGELVLKDALPASSHERGGEGDSMNPGGLYDRDIP